MGGWQKKNEKRRGERLRYRTALVWTMTKYGAVRVLPGLLGDSSRLWCCQARLADERLG